MHAKHVRIKECTISSCSYNNESMCHAMAITVGGPEPNCDTFADLRTKGGVEETGEVGACKVMGCGYNSMLECMAPGIKVGMHESHADCLTFKSR